MTTEPIGVAVVGAGTMGAGIAYVFAMAGFDVHLVEPDAARSRSAVQVMAKAGADAVRRGKADEDLVRRRLGAVTLTASVDDLPAGLGLAIESVPERLEIKRAVLSQIDRRSPGLIATNTSSLSIDDLSASVSDPGRFVGMHFFNPVWSLMLVEIVRGDATTDAAIEASKGFATAIGKKTAVVADHPGFATSRLDLVLALEAIRMVEAGVSTPEDIDRAVTTAYRHPMGPLRLSDVVGLDVRLDIARHLEKALGPHFSPPRLLQEMVARGDLGRKSGRGFYDWSGSTDF
ncbi:3-hydroxyacyl-CoA dehydrogenase family protein [Aquibium carbonis]|uniref:3-hydroxyacyl-CoA dehydrogenase family protein n=1 Tax=Aquibium carbonis TaxID=2495581 RepID=A0A429Z1W1_9HYPH|nr:3-hydroxyacyl-CoA dehydrogenase family protein [Aquibium carbonis]RST87695.1 3-hydroxyacyl-CoA dehydrogenase family protein [Aquibium carbonis]